MPTTQVAKLLNRQGNLTDLPLLDPGELGYAKDVKRLFIGNDPISVNSNGVSGTNKNLPPYYSLAYIIQYMAKFAAGACCAVAAGPTGVGTRVRAAGGCGEQAK